MAGPKGAKKNPTPYGRKDSKTGLNPRQEAFCQYYARGWNYVEAYTEAGYDSVNEAACETEDQYKRRVRRAAIYLANRPAVRKRLDELQADQIAKVNEQRLAVTDKYAMNIEKLTLMLLEDRHFARTGELSLPGAEQLTSHVKASATESRSDARAAVQATMGLAKLHGLLVDKSEVTVQGSISRMSNEELLTFIHKVHTEIGPMIEIVPNDEFEKQLEDKSAYRKDEEPTFLPKGEYHHDEEFAFPPKGNYNAPMKKGR